MGQGLIFFFFYALFQIVVWIAGAIGYLLGFLIVGVQSVFNLVFKKIKKLLMGSKNDRQTY